MTWRRRTGSVTSAQAARVSEFLSGAGVIALIETEDHSPDSVQIVVAVNREDHVAIVSGTGHEHRISEGLGLRELAEEIAENVSGEVVFGDIQVRPDGKSKDRVDPFEQPLGADIALFVDRTVVFTRGDHEGVVELATQVDDIVHARDHLDGHLVCITEGPIMTSIEWPASALPAVLLEQGASDPLITVVPQDIEFTLDTDADKASSKVSVARTDAYLFMWDTQISVVPTGSDLPSDVAEAVHAFADMNLGLGVLVHHLMKSFPAVEPIALRAALEGPVASMPALIAALDLPADLLGYLQSETQAEDLIGVERIQPDTFVENVRRVMSEASTTMSETAEAMRTRAVAVRVRTETAFDAAETFAEEVALPAHQSWANPALAATEVALGVLALRKARRMGGLGGGVLGTTGALLLADAVVNTVIALAPMLRRKREV